MNPAEARLSSAQPVAAPAELAWTTCQVCLGSLELHQPDFDTPTRMLGTCPDCKAWFVLDADRDTIVRIDDAA
jgi:hypothetical protein